MQDPSAVESILAAVGSLNPAAGSSGVPTETPAPSAPQTEAAAPVSSISRGNISTDKRAFLEAMRPLLREDKRAKLDTLERALTASELLSKLMKG